MCVFVSMYVRVCVCVCVCVCMCVCVRVWRVCSFVNASPPYISPIHHATSPCSQANLLHN